MKLLIFRKGRNDYRKYFSKGVPTKLKISQDSRKFSWLLIVYSKILLLQQKSRSEQSRERSNTSLLSTILYNIKLDLAIKNVIIESQFSSKRSKKKKKKERKKERGKGWNISVRRQSFRRVFHCETVAKPNHFPDIKNKDRGKRLLLKNQP